MGKIGAFEALVVDRVRRIVNDVEELTVVRTVERIGLNLNEPQLAEIDGERARIEASNAVVVEVDTANGALEAAKCAVVDSRNTVRRQVQVRKRFEEDELRRSEASNAIVRELKYIYVINYLHIQISNVNRLNKEASIDRSIDYR